jgi:hypothetical protein
MVYFLLQLCRSNNEVKRSEMYQLTAAMLETTMLEAHVKYVETCGGFVVLEFETATVTSTKQYTVILYFRSLPEYSTNQTASTGVLQY